MQGHLHRICMSRKVLAQEHAESKKKDRMLAMHNISGFDVSVGGAMGTIDSLELTCIL